MFGMQTASLSTVAALRLSHDVLADSTAVAALLARACRLIDLDPTTDLYPEEQSAGIQVKVDLTPPVGRRYESAGNGGHLRRGVCRWLDGEGLSPRMVDATARPSTGRPPSEETLQDEPLFVNIEAEEIVEILIDSRLYLVPRCVMRPNVVINLACVDFDGWGWYAGAIAGLTGCLPGLTMHPAHWFAAAPRILAVTLVDLLVLIRPALSILEIPLSPDGDVLALVGRDPVAIDATVAHWLGLSADEIPAVRMSAEAGLGLGWPETVPLVGDSVDPSDVHRSLAFDRPTRVMLSALTSGLLYPLTGPVVKHDPARCMRCGICVSKCPARALALDDIGRLWRSTQSCRRCWRCRSLCQEGCHYPRFSRFGKWLDDRRRRICAL